MNLAIDMGAMGFIKSKNDGTGTFESKTGGLSIFG